MLKIKMGSGSRLAGWSRMTAVGVPRLRAVVIPDVRGTRIRNPAAFKDREAADYVLLQDHVVPDQSVTGDQSGCHGGDLPLSGGLLSLVRPAVTLLDGSAIAPTPPDLAVADERSPI